MDYIIIGQRYDTGIALYYCPIFLINVLCYFYYNGSEAYKKQHN